MEIATGGCHRGNCHGWRQHEGCMTLQRLHDKDTHAIATRGNNRTHRALYSTIDVDPREIARRGYENLLNKIYQLFQTDEVLSKSHTFCGVTEHALQLDVSGVRMDVMVSPSWGRPGNLYSYLESVKPQHRSRYSNCN